MSVIDSKTNAPLYTYSIQKISKSVPDVKVLCWWLARCPDDIGELSLCENCALLSPREVHPFSNVLTKSIIRNMNSTGAML